MLYCALLFHFEAEYVLGQVKPKSCQDWSHIEQGFFKPENCCGERVMIKSVVIFSQG